MTDSGSKDEVNRNQIYVGHGDKLDLVSKCRVEHIREPKTRQEHTKNLRNHLRCDWPVPFWF